MFKMAQRTDYLILDHYGCKKKTELSSLSFGYETHVNNCKSNTNRLSVSTDLKSIIKFKSANVHRSMQI